MTLRQIKKPVRISIIVMASLGMLWNAGRSFAQSAKAVSLSSTPGQTSGVEILSDTRGVDFDPYIREMLKTVRSSWSRLIAEQDGSTLANKDGWTLIRLTISPEGTLTQVQLDSSSHEPAIDHSAWGAVTQVKTFSPLPRSFAGPNLEVRIRFKVGQDGARNVP